MSDKLHEMVSFIKRYHVINGSMPTKNILFNEGFSDWLIRKHGMKQLAELSGISDVRYNPEEIKKVTNQIFNVDLEKHLNSYQSKENKEHPSWSKILVLGDVHFPYDSKSSLEKVYQYCEYFQPEYIIQLGDLLDFYSFSKYPRSHNEFTPREEVRLGREGAENMWRKLKSISPKSKCYQLLGNHCVRPVKRVMEHMPEAEDWLEGYFKELFTFEGVNSVFDTRDELVIDEILFTHGFLGKEGAHRDFYLRNVVFGHLHKLWVQYRRFHNQQFFEACAGFLGEPESKGLSYTPSKASNYQEGILSIDKFGPRPIHF